MSEEDESTSKCILIVDDDDMLRDGLRIDLENNGYEVLVAFDGTVALEIMEKRGKDIHLIISDERMKVMSGFELCDRVKANPAWWPIPLVFLTARTDEKDFLHGFRLGASDYLVKPYCYEKLIVIVEKRIADYVVIQEHFADELERARLESIEQMSRGVIHDMTGILTDLGFGEVVREYLDQIRESISAGNVSCDEVRVAVNRIDEHCQELKEAIDLGVNLLDGLQALCRGDGEKKTLQMLGDIVKIPLGLFQRNFAVQGIEIECELSEVLINCRKQDVIQVALNLIRNAAHAMETGLVKRLRISTWEEDDHVFLSVSDTGCGILPEDRRHIFDWGFTTKRSGKGVGMPTVKRIMENHQGTITFETEVGKGTTFTVAFPAYHDVLKTTF